MWVTTSAGSPLYTRSPSTTWPAATLCWDRYGAAVPSGMHPIHPTCLSFSGTSWHASVPPWQVHTCTQIPDVDYGAGKWCPLTHYKGNLDTLRQWKVLKHDHPNFGSWPVHSELLPTSWMCYWHCWQEEFILGLEFLSCCTDVPLAWSLVWCLALPMFCSIYHQEWSGLPCLFRSVRLNWPICVTLSDVTILCTGTWEAGQAWWSRLCRV